MDDYLDIPLVGKWLSSLGTFFLLFLLLGSFDLVWSAAKARLDRKQKEKPHSTQRVKRKWNEYKRAFSRPLFKCITQESGLFLLREIHEGSCGSGSHTLACQARRQAFYWPTMAKDAVIIEQRWFQCLIRGFIPRGASTPLQAIKSPWPFANRYRWPHAYWFKAMQVIFSCCWLFF